MYVSNIRIRGQTYTIKDSEARDSAATAETKANAAQATAEEAIAMADEAEIAANNAQTIAENAFTASGAAFESAETANEKAEEALDSIPTKTSELENDSGFLTEHQSLAAYRTAAAQDEIDAALRFRPNLLDNWYFGNPVNQREQSIYTGTGYGIDRWKSRTTSLTVTVNDSNVNVASSSSLGIGNQMWTQPLENGEKLAGKKLTATVLVDSCNGSFALYFGSSGTISKRVTSTEFSESGLYTVSGICPNDITDFNVGIIKRSTGDTSFSIAAAKLEIGSSQTLAFQDGGAWVLNEIPNYSTELLKCQRHFFTLVSYLNFLEPLAFGVCANASTARFTVTTPVPMRNTPTLTNGLNGTSVRLNGSTYQINSLNATGARGNTIYISATCTELPPDELCALVGYGASGENKRIDFSAEL